MVAQSAPDFFVQADDLTVNLESKIVEVGGRLIHLTDKEFKLLECLCLHQGYFRTREQLMDYVYANQSDEPYMQIIDVLVANIRRKLDPDHRKRYIGTRYRLGYMLRDFRP